MLSRIGFLVLLAAASGCGSIVDAEGARLDAGMDSGPPADPCAGESIALEDLAECYARAYCGLASRCLQNWSSVEDCLERDTFPAFIRVRFQAFTLFVQDGTSEYDGEAAAQCIQIFETAFCNLDGDPDACDRVFAGNLADGQVCFADNECGMNGRCEGPGVEDLACVAGTCTNAAPQFGDCSTRSCLPGLHCVQNPVTMASTCLSGEVGAPCRTGFGDGPGDCDLGNYCETVSPDMLGQCQPRKPDGEPCARDGVCQAPLTCLGDDTPAGVGVCKPAGAIGDDCDDQCINLLFCDLTGAPVLGKCTALPEADEPCIAVANGSQDAKCNSPDLYCDEDVTGLCKPRLAVGIACTDFDSCVQGASCRNMMCTNNPKVGESCDPVVGCYGNCQAGTCEGPQSCYP